VRDGRYGYYRFGQPQVAIHSKLYQEAGLDTLYMHEKDHPEFLFEKKLADLVGKIFYE